MNEETKQALKTLGLEKLETLTKESVDAIFKAIELIVVDSENKIDDMILPVLPFIKSRILDLVEKINP